MENTSQEKKKMVIEEEEPFLTPINHNPKGGLRTMPFIIANESMEKVASYGLGPNMILYLMRDYHMEMTSASNLLYLWSAATSFMSVLAAFLADSFVGRFRMIGFGSVVSLLGVTLLWITTMIPQAKPPPCEEQNPSCISTTTLQLLFLCSSFGLMSIGAGGIRSSSLAFGADQLKKSGNPKNAGVLESYFSWYYASMAVSLLVAITCVVYIQDTMGWSVGFGVPVVLMFFSAVSFYLASSFYVKLKAKTSFFAGFCQVVVVAFRNRHLNLSPPSSNVLYRTKKGSMMLFPSQKLRFLNKACMIKECQNDSTLDEEEKTYKSWTICTVNQVEEFKALIKVIPIWSSGMLIQINMCQNSFPVLQASSMNRRITSSFEFPAGSFGVFTVISMILWISLYDRVILPFAQKITGKPIRLTTKQKMGLGIFFSFLAMLWTAVIENFRRRLAIAEGYPDTVQMSAMWIVPQYLLLGLAEAVNIIAQNEFFYSEFPRSMSSIALTLTGLGASGASLLASFVMTSVDRITRSEGWKSWITSDINEGYYDYYYCFLASLSLFNMAYFIVCCRAYGPCEDEGLLVSDDGVDIGDE